MSGKSGNSWKKRHPEAVRKYNLRQAYGLSVEDYEALLVKQDGLCAVCRIPSPKRLHVDHDHMTTEVRGLLCFKCNSALGLADDSAERLKALADYLEAK